MLSQYLPILFLFLFVAGFAISTILLSKMVGPRKPSREKLSTYECGEEPIGDARKRFNIRFYIIAMLFIIFDIELVFLYPWAVLFRKLNLFGFVEMLIFVIILFLGYVYAWKKGALEWE